jgi:hypothetical protein
MKVQYLSRSQKLSYTWNRTTSLMTRKVQSGEVPYDRQNQSVKLPSCKHDEQQEGVTVDNVGHKM